MSSPVIILTGGEPLLRPDIFDIAAYGTGKVCAWLWRQTVRLLMKPRRKDD